MREREDEPEEPAEDEPGTRPTSVDDGAEGTEPGDGPNDEPAEGAGTHRGW